MTKYKLALALSFILLVSGCNQNKSIEEFTYKFSMESIGNFKSEISVNPDLSFTVFQTNQFFDKFDGTYRPININGTLSDDEYNNLKSLLEKARIQKMKDSYGFGENESNSDKTILYNIELEHDDIHKYITINLKADHQFSSKFIELIEYTNKLIESKIENRPEN